MNEQRIAERAARNLERDAQKLRVAEAQTRAKTYGAGLALSISEYYDALGDQIQLLVDEKHAVILRPGTREDFRALAKSELSRTRQAIVDELLPRHLKQTHTENGVPFAAASISSWTDPRSLWKLWIFALTEDDIDRACRSLPETGITEADRVAQIAKIDAEIAAIEKKLAAPPPASLLRT
jgi:hypothetical protein